MHRKGLLLFFVISIFTLFDSYAQALYYNERPEFLQANNVWCFGNQVGLDFSTDPPTLFQTNMNTLEGAASVAHPMTGELLFYTPGRQVFNRNGQVMPNGGGVLGAGGSTTQGVCIVPMIGDSSKYYLFSLRGPTDGGPIPGEGALFYSVIDMRLDNGLGDIVSGQKNISLDDDTLGEAMIAIPGNNCDVWLMVHKVGDPVFKAYHITVAGVDPIPVISSTGSQLSGFSSPLTGAYSIGAMAVSPDRTKLAICSYSPPTFGSMDHSGVLVCDYDPNTGMVSNAALVDSNIVTYSLAFSQENSMLYFVNENVLLGVFELLQYDVSSMNALTINGSKEVISSPVFPYLGCVTASLRLYGGKIYVRMPTDTLTLGIVHQPNLSGVACGFDPNYVQYDEGKTVLYSIANEVVYAFPPDTLNNRYLDTVICRLGEVIEKHYLSARSGYSGYIWDNGDTGSTRSIDSTGVYWVLCIDSCHSQIDTFHVTMVDLYFNLGNDTVVCADDRIVLQRPEIVEDGVTWEWQDGSAGKTHAALQAGLYKLTASKLGCTYTDSLQVSFMQDFQPDLGEDLQLCKGIPVSIRLDAPKPANGSVLWNTGSDDATILVKDTGIYIVTVSLSSCEGTDSVRIEYQVCECAFFMPNAFSPNGDGMNDFFNPVIESGCDVKGYTLNVFNRFGQRIYSSIRPELGWDGMQNGIPVETGTYMWEVRFTGGTKGLLYYQKGDVTLIR